MRIAFLDCELDSGRRRLLRKGRPVDLSPKAFQLLELLVERRPNLVTKAEIQDRLWPETYVVDANVHNLVAEIRSALGDDSRRPRYVRTLARQGYAFEAPGYPEEGLPPSAGAGPWLVWQGRELALAPGRHLLGRAADTLLPLVDRSVSRHHAAITALEEEVFVEDLGSKNGTFVRGARTRGRAILRDGDELRLGTVKLVFRMRQGDASTTTASTSTALGDQRPAARSTGPR